MNLRKGFLLFTFFIWSTSLQAADKPLEICRTLGSQNLLGVKTPFFPFFFGALHYRLDKHKLTKWMFPDQQSEGQNSTQSQILIVSLLSENQEVAHTSEKDLMGKLKDSIDHNLLKLIRSKNADECEKRALKMTGIQEKVVESLNKFNEVMGEIQRVASFKANRALRKFVAETQNTHRAGPHFELMLNSGLKELIDTVRNLQHPVSLVIAAHTTPNGKIMTASGLEVPLRLLFDVSPNLKGVYFLTCNGENVFKRYVPSSPSFNSGYVKTGKIVGRDVNLSVKAIGPLLEDLATLKNSVMTTEMSSKTNIQFCHISFSKSFSGPLALFHSQSILAVNDDGEFKKTGFDCSLLKNPQSSVIVSKLNLLPAPIEEFPEEVYIETTENNTWPPLTFKRQIEPGDQQKFRDVRYFLAK